MRNSYPVKLLNVLFFISLLSACNKDVKDIQPLNASSADFSTQAARPNIILVIADDIGREIPTYNGGQSYSTPNLDYLAANGKQFSSFLSHLDGPHSRLALVTGQYNYRNWVHFGYLPPSSLTFANMLQSRGYATCFTGKWKFDGGDVSVRNHGFKKYLVFMPFNPDDNNGHDQFYRRYKNPYLYADAHYLTDAEVKNKYSEDMFLDYASKFIDSNKNKPFLLVYSNNLVQKPWVPTPEDPGYTAWNPAVDDDTKADTAYFPGMVAYMDKTIGRLVTKVKNASLLQRTVIIFISDNATNGVIGQSIRAKL